jgi:uncharacterized iron-regulated protein
MIRALALWACLCFLGASPVAASDESWASWAEEASKQHPLAGSFYWPRHGPLSEAGHGEGLGFAGKFQPDDDGDGRLYRPLAPDGRGPILMPPATIFLLGEVHDNPMHHRLRAWLIGNRPARRSWGAAVFEQVRADQQPALEQFKALDQQCCRLTNAVELFRLLQWDKSGWPPAEIYRPLFDAVIAAGLPIYPGDPPRDRVRAVAKTGAGALATDERTKLRLDSPLPGPLAEALNRELADSHCGALPPKAISGMAAAQHYRDAHLADALLGAAARHGSAILIAGNGHVRSDRGVPWHIRQRKPDARVMSVVLVEVEDGKIDPAAYLPRDPAGKPAADLLIFTLKADRDDPCQVFRKDPSPSRPPKKM